MKIYYQADLQTLEKIHIAPILPTNKEILRKLLTGKYISQKEANIIYKDPECINILSQCMGERQFQIIMKQLGKKNLILLNAVMALSSILFLIIVSILATTFFKPQKLTTTQQLKIQNEIYEKKIQKIEKLLPHGSTNIQAEGNEWYTFQLYESKILIKIRFSREIDQNADMKYISADIISGPVSLGKINPKQ